MTKLFKELSQELDQWMIHGKRFQETVVQPFYEEGQEIIKTKIIQVLGCY